jgi:hypothetical protein
MSATVRRANLLAALNAHLNRAFDSLAELIKAERPEFNRYWNPKQSVVDFLYAARGVVSVAETIANKYLQPGEFKTWREAWEARLTAVKRDLWMNLMHEREAQQHSDGGTLEAILIPVTDRHTADAFERPGVISLKLYECVIRREKEGVRFKAYPSRKASEVCSDYLALCTRFVSDFVRQHAQFR